MKKRIEQLTMEYEKMIEGKTEEEIDQIQRDILDKCKVVVEQENQNIENKPNNGLNEPNKGTETDKLRGEFHKDEDILKNFLNEYENPYDNSPGNLQDNNKENQKHILNQL